MKTIVNRFTIKVDRDKLMDAITDFGGYELIVVSDEDIADIEDFNTNMRAYRRHVKDELCKLVDRCISCSHTRKEGMEEILP